MAIAEVQEAGKSSVVVRFTEKNINATNAQSVTEELKAIIAEYPHLTLVMNFENVEFISSAGLRALLIAEGEAQKECDQKISIFDVAPFVMKTFEETGLTQIFHVYEKMQEYSLDGVEQIGRGTNGVIYRIDKENLIPKVSELLMDRIDYHMHHRTGGQIRTAAIMFSTQYGLLGKTKDADEMLRCLR